MSYSFTFHNVGQGLFYAGNIKKDDKNFDFIYDCGSDSLKIDELNSRIDDYKSTLVDKKLDLLIISHFHADHINGLERLLEDITIEKVVLPYLSPSELLVYLALNKHEEVWYYRKISWQNHQSLFCQRFLCRSCQTI